MEFESNVTIFSTLKPLIILNLVNVRYYVRLTLEKG